MSLVTTPALTSALTRLLAGTLRNYKRYPVGKAARLIKMGMRSVPYAKAGYRLARRTKIPRIGDRRRKKKSYARRATHATGSSAQRETQMSDDDMPLRTLTTSLLVFPRRDSQNNEKYNRTGRFLYFSGIRICESFVNRSPSNLAHYEIHYCMWQPKSDVVSINDFIAENKNEHFRDTRNDDVTGNTKNVSAFFDYDPAQPTFDMKYSCMPMSPDKVNIIFHWRKRIGPSSIQGHFESDVWKLEKWVPIKKKIEFNDSEASIPRRPFVIQCWATCHNKYYWDSVVNAAGVDKTNVVQRSYKHQIYTHNVN